MRRTAYERKAQAIWRSSSVSGNTEEGGKNNGRVTVGYEFKDFMKRFSFTFLRKNKKIIRFVDG